MLNNNPRQNHRTITKSRRVWWQSGFVIHHQKTAIIFLIAISFSPAFADTFQDSVDGFFGWIGSSVKEFVGDDYTPKQTEKINETIDSGIDAGSIAVQMWKVFHTFVVNAILLVAILIGIEIGERVAFIIGIIITLFIVGMLLKHFVFESWKIVLAILGFLAVLFFLGVTFIEV